MGNVKWDWSGTCDVREGDDFSMRKKVISERDQVAKSDESYVFGPMCSSATFAPSIVLTSLSEGRCLQIDKPMLTEASLLTVYPDSDGFDLETRAFWKKVQRQIQGL
jgi:hypothetical protein